jgi:GNAT superfamily N-acetyltransferase
MADVRARRAEDLPGLVAALEQVHRTDGYPSRWPKDPAAWLTPRGLLAAWVAVADDDLIGHIALARHELARPVRHLAVNRLFVSPAARKGGAATRLLQVATEWAASEEIGAEGGAEIGGEAGAEAGLWLEVTEGSAPAIAFYVRHGWQFAGSAQASWTTASGERPVVRRYLAPRR